MALTRELKAIITADVSRFRRGMAAAAATSQGFGGRVRAAVPALAMLGKVGLIAGAAAGTTLAVGLAKAGRAAAEAEASNARLTAQLKALGQNTDAVRQRVDKTVTSLSLMSGFDDEDIQDTFSGLARASGDANKALAALPVTLDLARARQMDVGAAGKLVERVLAGNVGGLKRYGIAVEEGMTPTEALGLLQTKVAGQAKAFGETAAGGMERAKVAAENAFERVGVALTPVMNALGNFAAEYLPIIAERIAGALEGVVGWVRQHWPTISAVVGTVFSAVVTHVQTVWVPIFQTAISVIRSVVDIVRTVWPTLVQIIRPVMSIIQGVVQSALGAVRDVFAIIAALLRGDVSGAFRGLGSLVGNIVGGIARALAAIPGTLVTIAGALLGAAFELGRRIAGEIIRGIGSLPGAIVQKVASWFGADAVGTGVQPFAVRDGKVIGLAISSGIGQGIVTNSPAVQEAARSVVRAAKDAAKSEGQIKSPSAVMAAQVGRPLAEGIAAGFVNYSPTLKGKVTAKVREAILSARGALQSGIQNLASMAGELRARPKTAEAEKLQAQLDAAASERERKRLTAERDALEAGTTERMEAETALAEFETGLTIKRLQAEAAAESQATQDRMANLTAAYNSGLITAKEFRDSLTQELGVVGGQAVGAAFAYEFQTALAGVLAQVDELNAFRGSRVTGPGAVRPSGIAGAKPKPPKKPKTKKAANGAFLRRAIIAGEAGPEAVLPLDGEVGRRALARAMSDASRMRGNGSGTVINLTFTGVLDAREAARRIQPELDKIVSLI